MKSDATEDRTAVLRETAAEVAAELDPDPGHARQVTKLALQLFGELAPLHHLGEHERLMLEISALLHDTGWSRSLSGKHHKHSRDIILETDLPGLRKRERLMCALIARYHRKAEPAAKRHKRFAALSDRERNIVEWLAGILRVADGLDRGHCDAIRNVSCRIGSDDIKIRLEARGDCETEIWGARRKENLLRRKTGKELVIKKC
jgi:exopolyphosphatase/guanosine-5'-triphosphate,3'-diphosphate pyrophosphatase